MYPKTALVCGRSTQECYAEVCEAVRDRALPYQTVGRRVQVFKGERAFTAGTHYSGHSVSTQTCL